jgi:hypothetical protein
MEPLMGKNEKTMVCDCGQAIVSAKPKEWCPKCGRAVFADRGRQRRNKISQFFIWAAFFLSLTFIVYLFVEMIAKPLLG